ncbi:hypothetical protein WK03_20090 [Burkholderia cepacia]|uniref:hypothetical protein n=1 Tax=Burkholderia cepacia TaxID=292 RepID=UPI00075A4486|nr:hypothetical protein [Burkholderia cepacia]KVQ42812.1 hypothetical protein WK03_20090 [Burkholderia cepacia]
MSQLVQIAPGVVFSADVLGTEWVRKFQQDDTSDALRENAQSAVQCDRSVKESDQAIHKSISSQLSLL